MKKPLTMTITGSMLALAFVAVGVAQDSTAAKSPAADNTKVNQRDRATSQRTADQAKETPTDRSIMQDIRKAIVADKSLSTYGHNIKVIAEHGKVTLKGPVHSEEERKSLEAKAVEVAGAGNVVNQISIKPDKGKSN